MLNCRSSCLELRDSPLSLATRCFAFSSICFSRELNHFSGGTLRSTEAKGESGISSPMPLLRFRSKGIWQVGREMKNKKEFSFFLIIIYVFSSVSIAFPPASLLSKLQCLWKVRIHQSVRIEHRHANGEQCNHSRGHKFTGFRPSDAHHQRENNREHDSSQNFHSIAGIDLPFLMRLWFCLCISLISCALIQPPRAMHESKRERERAGTDRDKRENNKLSTQVPL